MSTIIIMFNRCEDVELALPGNNQDLSPSAPEGTVEWNSTSVTSMDQNRAQIIEEISGTLGVLNAVDENPDDEFCFKITSQTIGNHFLLVGSDNDYCEDNYYGGEVKLELNNKPSYEALDATRTIEIDIDVMDDSPTKNKTSFKVEVEVTNVNEPPSFINTYQFMSQIGNEGIPYEYLFEYDDEDLGDSWTLSSSDLPTWLSISGNNITGTPSEIDSDKDFSFSVTVTDAGNQGVPLAATQAFNIDVSNNQMPEFVNQNFDFAWEEELHIIYTINVDDQSVDLDNLTVTLNPDPEEYNLDFIKISNTRWNLEGILSNSYVNTTIPFEVTLSDNRDISTEVTTETLQINVDPNNTPEFINANDFQELVHHGCTYDFTLEVNDDDPGSNLTFVIEENADWLNIIETTTDNTITVRFNGIPQESDIGANESISVTVSDNRPNVPLSEIQSFIIAVDRNYKPEFANQEDVDSTANVGLEYENIFGVNDDNGDDCTLSLEVNDDNPGSNWLYHDPAQFKIFGVPDDTHIGTHSVTVILDDGCEFTTFPFEIEVTTP